MMEDTRKTITVIMLTYNRENMIGRAIKSILAQSYTDFEFIIVDNGSTDKSGRIAEAYAGKDHRIKVIHKEYGNIGSGRNAGIDNARGDYICFIDDDDYADYDYLENLLELVQKYDADMSICGAYDKIFDEEKCMTPVEALTELMWRKKYNVAFPAKIYAAHLFHGMRFPLEGNFDDIALMYKIIGKAKRIAYNGQAGYTFYRHAGNHSSWTTDHRLITPEILKEYLYFYSDRTKWICNRFPEMESICRYFEWSFMISMVEKIYRLKLDKCKLVLQEMVDELSKNSDEFMKCRWIQDFETNWMNQFVL